MYAPLLISHNLLRWVVLLVCLIAVGNSFSKWMGQKPWTRTDQRIGSVLVMTADLQVLIGLLLFFFLSPLTRAAMANFKAALQDKEIRFFTLEHSFLMIGFLVLVHLGKVRSKRAVSDQVKHRTEFIWWGLSLLLLPAGLPWWRPLLRI
jgi:hypothetical protein